MTLKTHSTGTEGVYEDNLPRVAGVEVEIRKEKGDEGNLVAGVKVEETKRKDFFKIQGRTGFRDNYINRSPATAPEMLVGIS